MSYPLWLIQSSCPFRDSEAIVRKKDPLSAPRTVPVQKRQHRCFVSLYRKVHAAPAQLHIKTDVIRQ